MLIRQSNNFELWQGEGVHPASIGCIAEGREQCLHKYHLMKTDHSTCNGYDDFISADKAYTQITGEKSLNDTLIKKV